MTALRLSSAALGGLLLLGSSAAADTLFVDANLAAGANDGSDWANAYQGSNGLQLALAAATSGDEIWVADGVYEPTTGTARGAVFQLKNGVAIYGGFAGGEVALGDRPSFGTAPSVLSGDLAGNDGSGIYTDNSYHLLNGAGTNATAVINGFTVRGGNANGSGNDNKGGGILCLSGASPTVELCRFEDNRCTFGGGAGYINGSAPTFTDCEFVDNQGGSFGGAFDVANAGSVRYDRCWFEGNSAARAGALEIFSSTGVRVTNSVFKGNTSTGSGGGGAMWFGFSNSCFAVNNTVVGNTATSNAVGGILVSGTSITVANNILWDNEGPGGAQNSGNQISGASATYCIVEGGLAGAGNLATAPTFENAGADDYRLASGSVGIDAGKNTSVPAGITLDKEGKPRFWDVQTVPDTGSGGAPLVDIGAFELDTPPVSTAFCFGDQLGILCPCNNNQFPGTPEGCGNSLGFGGKLAASGTNVYANDDLVLTITQARPGQPSLIVQGSVAIETTFKDGIFCMGNPTERVEVVFLDGSGAGSSSGSIIANGNVPGPGVTRYYQAWYRDPSVSPCGTGSNFTHALQVDWL